MMTRRCWTAGAVAVGLLGCGRKPEGEVRPAKKASRHHGEGLPERVAAEAGMDEAKLRAFSEKLGGNGVVVRGGAVVHAWGHPETPLDVASAGKPVLGHLVLRAVETGKLRSLDEPVLPLLPELGQLNAALGHKDRGITWRHLVTQTSCYGVKEAPGTAFDYNDYQIMLLWTLLFEKLLGVKPEEATERVLRPELFDLLGANDEPVLRIREAPHPSGRLAVSARDMARFGLLYLHGGEWRGRRLLSEAHVKLALGTPVTVPRTRGEDAEMLPGARSAGGTKNQEEHLNSYSHLWWLNRRDPAGRLLWPSLPSDAFAAVGNGGVRTLMVLPGSDLVISWNKSNLKPLPMCAGGRDQMDAALAPLAAAIVS